MKYMVRKSYVQVVGQIWMPHVTASMEYTLSGYDIGNIRDLGDGTITREAVDQWLATHAGDFQSIIDFSASIEDGDLSIDIPWNSEEGEFAYLDTMAEGY